MFSAVHPTTDIAKILRPIPDMRTTSRRRAPICLIGTDEARIPHHSKNTSDAPSFRHARYPECFHISLDVLGSTKVPSLYNSRDALGGVDLSRDCAGQPRFFYPSCHRMTCHHHAM